MYTEEKFIIPVYCLTCGYYDRLYPNGIRRAGFAPKFSDVEALTLEIVGVYLGLNKDEAIYDYFKEHYKSWFPQLPDRSTLVRQWANLWQVKQQIWQAIVRDSGQDRDPVQTIDTVPLPVCHRKRAERRQIFQGDLLGEPDYGYCASKDWHYFGFKGGLRISVSGMIFSGPILPARPHDIDFDRQTELRAKQMILIKTPLRKNMKNRPPFKINKLENRVRKLIETVIAQLTERFGIQKMKVRKNWTLTSKWYRKILAHTVCVFTNLMFHRTPTEIDSIVL